MNIENELVEALRNDPIIKFKREAAGSLTGGVCPSCGHKELFVSVNQPYRVMCNRRNNCGYAESTRSLYSFLFENLSERYPSTPTNPNATADAYLSVKRGFPIEKIKGWYEQGQIKMENLNYAETVRFPLWDGYHWDRLINEKDIRTFGDKAKIKYGTKFRNRCWQPPGQTIEPKDMVYIVEGIFHAIALHLSGHKVLAAISSSNLPRNVINANLGKQITWCLAFDNDEAGISASLKFVEEINGLKEPARIVLAEPGKDWDDVYSEGRLDADYLEASVWRGRIAGARTAKHRAFAMYCWRPFNHCVMDFNNKLYTVKVDPVALTRDLEGDSISWAQHGDTFIKCTTVVPISNCLPSFLHIEQDKFTAEQKYFFEVKMAYHRKPFLIGVSPNTLNEPKAFSTTLLSTTPGGRFDGGSPDLTYLMRKWTDREVPYVQTIPFIGYDEGSKAYIFPSFGYKDGRLIKANRHGYLQVGTAGLKTTLGSVPLKHSTEFDGTWIEDFIKVFDLNGIGALAFFTASLFTRQIKEKHQAFAFLELTGEKEAGKSTLIRFLWKLFGRDNYEGIDILTTSAASEGRTLSQLSNLPLVLMESDREPDLKSGRGGRPSKSVDWDNFKKIYDLDGVLMSRGVKTNDLQTNDSIFRGALVITQNASVQGSEAIMSRIVHLHCTTAHKKLENRPIADKLKTMEVESLCGYLHHALIHEQQYLSAFFHAFEKHRKRLTAHGINSLRVIDCHAQVMAAVEALTALFHNFPAQALAGALTHLVGCAEHRESRLSADHPVLEQFWDTYHYINNQVIQISDEQGDREVPQQVLNHSLDKSLIAINLNDFIERCRSRGQESIPINDLKQLLPSSHRHAYVANKVIRSRITGKGIRCWIFKK